MSQTFINLNLISKPGLMSSTKVDAFINNAKYDYLILVTMFDPTSKLMSVQGSIDIYGAPDDSDDEDTDFKKLDRFLIH